MIKDIYTKALQLLPADSRRQWSRVLVGQLIVSLLDLVSLASLLPIILLLLDPSISEEKAFINGRLMLGIESQSHFVIVVSLLVLILVIVKTVVSITLLRRRSTFVFQTASAIATAAMDSHLSQSYSKYSRSDFGKSLVRIASHPFAFANNILLPLINLFCEGAVLLLITLVIALFNPIVVLVLGLLVGPFLLLLWKRSKTLLKLNQALRKQFPILNTIVMQSQQAFIEIITFGKRAFFTKAFQETTSSIGKTFVQEQTIQAINTRLGEVIVAIVIVTLVIYTAIAGTPGREVAVIVALYGAASFRLIPAIGRITQALHQLNIYRFLLDDMEEPVSPELAEDDITLRRSLNEELALHSISFRYGAQFVLEDISLTIRKGQKVCLKGQSASGKSTLLHLVLGILTETSGRITWDGESLPANERMKVIGFVPQDPTLINDTIAHNVAFGTAHEEIDRKRVVEILQQLNLEDLVMLPKGIDTVIGENGVALSGGQRQRIAIARVLYESYYVLLLDEATNQLDETLETDIIRLLKNIPDLTILMVSHNDIPSSNFDATYELHLGRLRHIR